MVSYVFAPAGASFTPGITAGYIIQACLLGIILYKEKISLPRTIICEVLGTLIGDLAINTYFIYMFYGLTYLQLLGLRAATLIPWAIIEGILVAVVVKALNRVPAISKNLSTT